VGQQMCSNRHVPEDIERRPDLGLVLEVLEREELCGSSQLPLIEEEESDKDKSCHESSYDSSIAPWISDSTPLQSKYQASDEAEHDDGTHPIEGS
jgi:hypothetical protein